MSKFSSALGKVFSPLVDLAKRWEFPGHRNISLYEVLSFLVKEMQRDDIMQRSASVSFSLFVSLFPTLLVAFTLIPFLPIASFQATILTTMQQVMPHDVYQLLQSTIKDIVLRHRADLLSISLILAIYYSTRGVIGLMNSFDKALPTFRKRTFWHKQVVAFKITGLLSLLFLFSAALIIGGEWLVQEVMEIFHEQNDQTYIWLSVFRWVIIILGFYFSISLIYYYGPAKHKRWQFFSAGSTLATILLLMIALLYSLVINQFGQANKIYGSIGTLLVTQIWIYYNALGLLIGFELNASIEMNETKLQAEMKDDQSIAV